MYAVLLFEYVCISNCFGVFLSVLACAFFRITILLAAIVRVADGPLKRRVSRLCSLRRLVL